MTGEANKLPEFKQQEQKAAAEVAACMQKLQAVKLSITAVIKENNKNSKDYGRFCNFILNLLINIVNVVTLFIPYLILSKAKDKEYYKENRNIRGCSLKFYGKPVIRQKPQGNTKESVQEKPENDTDPPPTKTQYLINNGVIKDPIQDLIQELRGKCSDTPDMRR